MATNSVNLNEVNEETVEMDVGESSTIEEESQHQPLSHGFTNPLYLSGCIHFIILNAIITLVNEHIAVYLQEIFQILLSHNTILDNPLVRLQEFANKFALNLYVCTINQSGIEFRYLSTTNVQENGQSSCAFLVFDERNGNCYPFYAYDKNHREQTVFPKTDAYTMQLFQDLADFNYRSGHFDIPQQSSSQNKSLENQQENEEANAATTATITTANHTTVNTATVSKNADLLPKKFKSIDTIEHNSKEPSLNVENHASSRVRAPNDEDADTPTNASIVTDSFSSSNSRSTTMKNIVLLPKLKLLNQPTRFRRGREVKTVGRECPAVQVEGAPQRTPMLLKLPEEIRNSEEQFYIGIHAKKYDGDDHAQTRVTPKINVARKNHRSKSKKPEDLDQFDSVSNGVFSKVNQNDLKTLEKQITVLMFNLKQDEDINKDLIFKDKLIWCRLMFAIYTKSSNGEYKCVSPPVYSDLIEHTNGSQSLVFENIFPNQFCECGGQIIFIQLNELVDKCDLCVRCNGKVLDQYDYQIAKTVLSFETPARLSDENHLHIIIDKKKTKDWIVIKSQYHSHYDHPEPCGVINKD